MTTSENIERADAATRPRAAVIVNPSKSGGKALRKAVELAERRQGFAPTLWLETTVEEPGRGLAVEAIDAGVDLIIAAGGDGTVRAVAAALLDTGMPLGVVPLGTGNLLARNLHLPVNDIADAVVLAFSGVDRAIDALIAEVLRPDGAKDKHLSLVMSGIGIDAAMIAGTNDDLKKRIGWLAYIDAGIRALPKASQFRVAHRIDGGRRHHSRVSSLLVANLGTLPGGVDLAPDAAIDNGELEVIVLQPRNVIDWLLFWRRVSWENRVLRSTPLGRQLIELTGGNKRREVVYRRGRTVEIAIDDPSRPEPFEVDGEDRGTIISARFHVRPSSLIVRVAE